MNKGQATAAILTIFAFVVGSALYFASPQPALPGEVHDHHDITQHETPADVEFTLYAYLDGFQDENGAVNPTLEVAPGDVVQITLINGQALEHNFVVVEGNETLTHGDHIQEGESTAITFTAPDCDCVVTYLCAVEGHQEAGMEGSIVVEEHGGH